MRVKVGGAGSVELVLDGWVDEGDDGGVEDVDESALGDSITEVGAQKRVVSRIRLMLEVLKLMSIRMRLKLWLSKDWVQILKMLFMTSVELDVGVDYSVVKA